MNIFWGIARIIAVFGFVVFVVSPAWDWLGGNGWEVAFKAYVRGTIASIGMLVFEIRRFRRTRVGASLNLK